MQEPSAKPTPPEPGPAPERFPRWSVGITLALGSLWLFVVLTAPWIAAPVKEIANDLDLAVGLWSKARPDPDPPPSEGPAKAPSRRVVPEGE